MPSIKREDLKRAKGKEICFLGKFDTFSKEEIERLLEKFDIKYSDEVSENSAIIIEGKVLSAVDEERSYEAYKRGALVFGYKDFEKFYSENINPDSLLMSLKLSNNQDRILRLLKNESIADRLFLKVLRLYDWKEEGLMESDENRAVTSSFIKRFYKKERVYDPTVIYSPSSLYHIILSSDDPEVLESLLYFPDFRFTLSRKNRENPKTLFEALAANAAINFETQKRLYMKNSEEIDRFLALNEEVDRKLLNKLYERGSKIVRRNLAANNSIDESLFEKLLSEDREIVEVLLEFQRIDNERLNKIRQKNLEDEIFASLGKNENLSKDILRELIKIENLDLLRNIASNRSVSADILDALYRKSEDVDIALASNPNSSIELLKKLFKREDRDIDIALAANISSPKEILDALYERGDLEINKALATNESVEEDRLREFMLDSSLKPYLVKNRTFTESILRNLGI